VSTGLLLDHDSEPPGRSPAPSALNRSPRPDRRTVRGTVALSRYMIIAPQIFLSGVGTKPVRQAESGIWWPSSTRRR